MHRTTMLTGTALAVLAAVLIAPATASAAAAPTTPLTGTLTGTITAIGTSGTTIPVPGVIVFSYGEQRVTTDSSGHYTLTVPAFDETRVCFLVPVKAQKLSDWGFIGHCHGSDAPLADSIGTPFDLAPGATVVVDDVLPAAAGIRGTVFDAAHQPVAGATVYAPNDADPAATTTSATGTFVIRGAYQGSSPVCVVATSAPSSPSNPGTAPVCQSVNAPAGQVTTVSVNAPKGGGVRGTVVDGNGIPVAGASIVAGSGTPVVTGDNGTFSVPHLAKGTTQVCATPPAGVNLLEQCTDVTVTAGAYTTVPVTLPTGATLTGVVTDVKGNPLSGVAVITDNRPSQPIVAVTGGDGRYRAVAEQPGVTAVCFSPTQTVGGGTSANGYVSACTNSVSLVAGVTTVSKKLTASGAVTGRVVDDGGRAVAGAAILVGEYVGDGEAGHGGQATTDTDGTYTVRNLPAGDYHLVGTHDAPGLGAPAGYLRSTANHDFTIKGVAARTVTSVVLIRGAGIDLLVAGPSGEPIPGAELTATVPDGTGTLTAGSDLQGRAVFAPTGVGTYHVCVAPVAARPGYPDGLTGRCVDVTTTKATVVRRTVTLALASN